MGDLFIGFGLGMLATYIADKRGQINARKRDSKYAVAILIPLIEELDKGIEIMEKLAQGSGQAMGTLLPATTWEVMGTLPEAVVLRILALSNDKMDDKYHATKILSYLKNYFRHSVGNLNMAIDFATRNPGHNQTVVPQTVSSMAAQYLVVTKEIRTELSTILDGLKWNAKRWLPR